jgi:hypothetical protein
MALSMVPRLICEFDDHFVKAQKLPADARIGIFQNTRDIQIIDLIQYPAD